MGLLPVQLPGHTEPIALTKLVIGQRIWLSSVGMRLVAGRLLSDERAQDNLSRRGQSQTAANDGRNILIDEAAAKRLGFTPQQAVGKTIILGKSHVHIVGVVANVKFRWRARAGDGDHVMSTTRRTSGRCLSGCGPAQNRRRWLS